MRIRNISPLLLISSLLQFSYGAEHFVHIEITTFEVRGNGEDLHLPIFSDVISKDEIEYQVNKAEYYFSKLKNLYNFKTFVSAGTTQWEDFVSDSRPVNDGGPIYTHSERGFEFEILLTGYRNGKGEFSARTALLPTGRNRKKQIRHHSFQLMSGKSVSLGGLYDERRNRGYMFVISLNAMERSPEMTSVFIAKTRFLEQMAATLNSKEPRVAMFKTRHPSAAPLPPSPPDAPKSQFVPYDKAPTPIGGIQAIREALTYPEVAEEDGISGTVIVQAFIESSGITGDAVVLKGVREDLDEAALQAVKKVTWAPAEQKGEPVGVWISIPIRFQPN